MQLKPSPSMAQQLSAILADIAAPATHHQARSGLVTILHALILSALDHLIRCLETAFALWQAGQLPRPPIRRTRATTSRPSTAPRAARPIHARRTPKLPRAPRIRPRATAPARAAPFAPPTRRPRQDRAPPPAFRQKAPWRPSQNCAQIVSISLYNYVTTRRTRFCASCHSPRTITNRNASAASQRST